MTALPPGWLETTIGSVAELNPPAPKTIPDDEDVSFVPMAAVEEESGRVDVSQHVRYGDFRRKSYRSFRDGDLLVAKITPSMENGKAAVTQGLSAGHGLGSTEFHVIRPHATVLARYLLHYVLQRRFRADAARRMTGTAGQLRVPIGYLREVPVPLPPLPEQQRIVDAIEEQFSRLDAGVASLRRAQRNLGRMRAAILSAAVEGRLVEREGGWATVAIGGDASTSTEVRIAMPDHWSLMTLGALCVNLRYGTSEKCDYGARGAPVLRIPNVRRQTIDIRDLKYAVNADADLNSLRVVPGDILFVRTNGSPDLIGRVGVVPASASGYAFASYLIRGRLRPEVMPQYVAIVLDGPQYRRVLQASAATSAGQYNLSASTLSRIAIPLPSLAEQERIVEEVDRQLSILDAMEATVTAGRARAERLRQSILREAFAGRLVRQCPKDEPGEALLDPIRAERRMA